MAATLPKSQSSVKSTDPNANGGQYSVLSSESSGVTISQQNGVTIKVSPSGVVTTTGANSNKKVWQECQAIAKQAETYFKSKSSSVVTSSSTSSPQKSTTSSSQSANNVSKQISDIQSQISNIQSIFKQNYADLTKAVEGASSAAAEVKKYVSDQLDIFSKFLKWFFGK